MLVIELHSGVRQTLLKCDCANGDWPGLPLLWRSDGRWGEITTVLSHEKETSLYSCHSKLSIHPTYLPKSTIISQMTETAVIQLRALPNFAFLAFATADNLTRAMCTCTSTTYHGM